MKKSDKKHYRLKAETGKVEISGMPTTLIKTKIRILKNPKNLILSVFGAALGSLIGFIVGGIIGIFVGFALAVVLLFIIGPTKETIKDRDAR